MLSPSLAITSAPPPTQRAIGYSCVSESASWFDEVAAAHLPALRARAVQMCRGELDADDLVQDALERAFLARHQVRDPSRARGWLLAIVTNTFLDLLRRRRVRPGEVALEIDPAAPEPSPVEAWEELTLDDVRRAIELLPEDVRDTYRMFAFDGKDYKHIAAELGVPKATVGTRISRARRRLRGILLAPERGTHVQT
ncbi:MAG: sigma-70 family RNA polymerase sigma factor [Kofleriaceae bacterium]